MSSAPEAPHEWAGAHADINLTTVLPRATTAGLQVRTKAATDDTDAVWVDAAPPEGHVIINTGIMLERISNGIIPSGWHRVVADPDLGNWARALLGGAVLPPHAVDDPGAAAVDASRPRHPPASPASRPPTCSTRCSTRSTWSRTPAGSEPRVGTPDAAPAPAGAGAGAVVLHLRGDVRS